MNKDVTKHALSEVEWQVLQEFELILTVSVSRSNRHNSDMAG